MAAVTVRAEVTPPWPYRLPRSSGADGLTPVRGGVMSRLLHDAQGDAVVVQVAQRASGAVLFAAAAARTEAAAGTDAAVGRDAAEWGIARMRRALGVDLDLAPFHRQFRNDPLIGAAVRANPLLRPAGRPTPFEALAWAVTEQLIEFNRAAAIQRRLVWRFGARELAGGPSASGLRDSPAAARLAALAPAQLEALDLSAGRALALIRAARVVASGRARIDSDDMAAQAAGWRALRQIPGIGAWTVEMLAVVGQGRLDQLPAGDLGFLKLVGRLQSGGDPHGRASEDDVRELFEPYGEWRALAAAYALRGAGLVKSPIIQRE